jgi:hypothetical protein
MSNEGAMREHNPYLGDADFFISHRQVSHQGRELGYINCHFSHRCGLAASQILPKLFSRRSS